MVNRAALAVLAAGGMPGLVACGGTVGDEAASETCNYQPPDRAMTSTEAARATLCLTGAARLLSVFSTGPDTLDPFGRAEHWELMTYTDDEETHVVFVSPGTANYHPPRGWVPDCNAPDELPASSAILTPDALQRVQENAPDLDLDWRYGARHSCASDERRIELFGHTPEWDVRVDVRYTWDGKFIDLCFDCP